jgi:uncharacterized CHY-type Zn-finger protein
MKIVLCGVCRKELNETPDPSRAERIMCPVCGSVSRMYEESSNFERCETCQGIIDFITFIENKGLCYKCVEKNENPTMKPDSAAESR